MSLAEQLSEQQASAPPREGLREIAGRARPVSLAGERQLPVLAALESILPQGLRRGSTVAVAGSTSLALAVVAGASRAGSWCAAVGAPTLGLVAAAEVGVVLERFPLVASPGRGQWATVVAALLDAFDMVLAWPPPHVRAADTRRLVARARERGAVLVMAAGPRLPEVQADVRLTIAQAQWEGLGRGHGRLRARRLEVVAHGRGAATRERRAWLWLPAAEGGLASATPAEPVLDGGVAPWPERPAEGSGCLTARRARSHRGAEAGAGSEVPP